MADAVVDADNNQDIWDIQSAAARALHLIDEGFDKVTIIFNRLSIPVMKDETNEIVVNRYRQLHDARDNAEIDKILDRILSIIGNASVSLDATESFCEISFSQDTRNQSTSDFRDMIHEVAQRLKAEFPEDFVKSPHDSDLTTLVLYPESGQIMIGYTEGDFLCVALKRISESQRGQTKLGL